MSFFFCAAMSYRFLTIVILRWMQQSDSSVKDFVMGQWVINDSAGIRSYPYSTSAYVFVFAPSFCHCHYECSLFFFYRTTNPLRYSSLKTLGEVHGAYPKATAVLIFSPNEVNQTLVRPGPTSSTTYMRLSSPLTDFLPTPTRTLRESMVFACNLRSH